MLKNRKILYMTGLVLLAITMVSMLVTNNEKPDRQPDILTSDASGLSNNNGKPVNSGQGQSIASAWQWDSFQAEPIPAEKSTSESHHQLVYLDVDYIYQALQAVKLDESGDIILDHAALLALNKTLANRPAGADNLDREALNDLKTMIKAGLPGKAGEQTAIIVENYYLYLEAESEFNDLYQSQSDINNSEEYYRELVALRELYLGADAADKLFATSDANAQYMFKSLELEADPSLTDEERQVQQNDNIKQHEELTIGVSDWHTRYADFLGAKQQILSAELPDEEKRRQISMLMQQHFSDEELEKVRHLQLDDL